MSGSSCKPRWIALFPTWKLTKATEICVKLAVLLQTRDLMSICKMALSRWAQMCRERFDSIGMFITIALSWDTNLNDIGSNCGLLTICQILQIFKLLQPKMLFLLHSLCRSESQIKIDRTGIKTVLSKRRDRWALKTLLLLSLHLCLSKNHWNEEWLGYKTFLQF